MLCNKFPLIFTPMLASSCSSLFLAPQPFLWVASLPLEAHLLKAVSVKFYRRRIWSSRREGDRGWGRSNIWKDNLSRVFQIYPKIIANRFKQCLKSKQGKWQSDTLAGQSQTAENGRQKENIKIYKEKRHVTFKPVTIRQSWFFNRNDGSQKTV